MGANKCLSTKKMQKQRPDRNSFWSCISIVSMENTASATGTMQWQ